MGGGCLDIFSSVYHFSFLSSLPWETARYRLKYCLKGPLNPKQPTTNFLSMLIVVFFTNYKSANLYLLAKIADQQCKVYGFSHALMLPSSIQKNAFSLERSIYKMVTTFGLVLLIYSILECSFLVPLGTVYPQL